MRELVIFHLGGLACALPLSSVREINNDLELSPVHRAPDYIRGVMNLRGEIVTIIDLRRKLGLPARELNWETRVVVVNWADENVGLLVDRVEDVTQVPAADFSPPPANLNGVAGSFFSSVLQRSEDLVAVLEINNVLAVETAVEEQNTINA